MRAELPWNVAGIPPEAREAARAAARREGLSVGEWLTRRIIAELGEGAAIAPASTGEPGPDFVSAAGRRETEAMLARLAQAEADASHTYRRIEEQLRGVGSGLDNAERSQSEMSRAMNRAASEITLAGNEQAQTFDQLGRHMAGLDQRVEKLERLQLQDGLREAVKGLHQGLTRLTDQFSQVTARSGGQVTSLARNLEQLALRLVQLRADTEAATEALDAHVGQLEETQTFTNGTIEHILGRIESEAEIHHQGLAEAGQRADRHQDVLNGIEVRLASLEEPDLAMEQRLQAIEQVLTALREELDRPDPHAGLAERLNQVSLRLDMAEQNQSELLTELNDGLAERLNQVSLRLDMADQNHSEMLTEMRDGLARIPEPVVPEPVSEEEPAAAEPVLIPEPGPPLAAYAEPFTEAVPVLDMLPPEPIAAPGMMRDNMPDNFAQHAFATHFEMPQDFADALTRPQPANDLPAGDVPANEQDFLANARRSAREAAEEDARSGLLGWIRPASRETDKSRPIPLIVLGALFFLLLAAAAVLMLKQRPAVGPPRPIPRHVAVPNTSALTFVPRLHIAQSRPVLPQTHPEPVKTPSVPTLAAPATDQVMAAANGGDDTAETIIGLRTLDAGDAAAAFQWLQKAALQGQPVAEYRLGTLYERGQGVAANPALAFKWYLAAANQGNRKAMHNLAVAYAEGSAGHKDMSQAAHWFEAAAALGLSDSEFNLAVLYERGDGVPQNLVDSYKWYSIAAAQGDAESKARVSVLKAQLSPAGFDAAERAAQSFVPLPLNRTANVPPVADDIGQ